jgi:hypothetical protein
MRVQPTILMAIFACGTFFAACGAGGAKLPDAASGSIVAVRDASLTQDGLTGGAGSEGSSSSPEGTGGAGGGSGGFSGLSSPTEEDGGDPTSSDAGAAREVGGDLASDGKAANNCPFPTSFKWTSSGPLAEPKSPAGHNFLSLKDFTVVKWKEQLLVFASVYDTKTTFTAVNINFADWSNMAAAPQIWMENTPAGATVSPSIIYFTPKKQWVMTFQWGFKYSTSSDPTQPSKWTAPQSLFASRVANSDTGPMDQTVICDSSKCYLFFTATNGNIYRSSMPVANFPGTFPAQETIVTEANREDANEAVQVYAVKGTGKYLMLVTAFGARGDRYFRAYSANSLGGKFTPMPGASSEATPFAGKNNITFTGPAWTDEIGQGDVVREDPSETQTIDSCKMQFLYQGVDPSKTNVGIGDIPYRPGLLTLVP